MVSSAPHFWPHTVKDNAMSDDVKLFQRVTIEQVEEGHELAPKFN